MPLPLPEHHNRWALFLDFDGTLAEIAETPNAVHVDLALASLLERLAARLDGALALVSGRRLEDLDARLAPLRLPAAGLHGLERRSGDGSLRGVPHDQHVLSDAKRRLQAFVADRPRLILEDKTRALALHYRSAPELERDCRRIVFGLVDELPGYHVLNGKMVLELKPKSAVKDSAIRAFLMEHPFRGRLPVFVGDDRTDEDGFAWVNEQGGVSIKVGDGETRARYRVDGVTALRTWLECVHAQLALAASGVDPS